MIINWGSDLSDVRNVRFGLVGGAFFPAGYLPEIALLL